MLVLKHLGLTDYATTLQAMQQFTQARSAQTPDELWLTEHPPVYTLGLNRKNVRLPQKGKSGHNIPVVLVDRGGKITYHGPGQVVIYCLIDLKRRGLNVRQLVTILEHSVVQLLAQFGILAQPRADAPGVYVGEAKIASLGLRLKKEYCYHGISLNVNMDLSPFAAIDPCGYAGMAVTQTQTLGIMQSAESMGKQLLNLLEKNLNDSAQHH